MKNGITPAKEWYNKADYLIGEIVYLSHVMVQLSYNMGQKEIGC